MKARTIISTVMVCMVAAAMCFASDPNMGTWKLNEAKSKVAAGLPKPVTVVYEAAGDKVKVTVDGIGADGQPMHNEWTGAFDNKDYPVTGDPSVDARSYKKINDNTLMLANKKNGKVTTTARVVVSADGKTRNVETRGMDSEGKMIRGIAVYDKQ
jgi:hypothetical protein